jgi:hypothetical protein
MADRFKDTAIDPATGTIPEYYKIRSTSKGGAGTGIIGVDDETVPSSATFPVVTPTRYILYTDYDIDYNTVASGVRDFQITDETRSQVLLRVDSDVTPSTNQFRIFDPVNGVANAIEVHVGVGSTQAGNTLSIEGYIKGGVIKADQENNPIHDSISVTGNCVGSLRCYDVATTGSGALLKQVAATSSITFELKIPVTAWFQWAGLGNYTFEIWSGGAWAVIHNAVSTDKTNQHLNPAYYRLSHAAGAGAVNMFITGVYGIDDHTNISEIAT